MLYFLISFLSFILLSKSFFHKSVPPWESEKRVFTASLLKKLSRVVPSIYSKSWGIAVCFTMPGKKKIIGSKTEKVSEKYENSLLDLPEFALECVIERLSPAELCVLSEVCRSLRDRCRSDHFWKKHMKQKWSSVIGDLAYKEWHLHQSYKTRPNFSKIGKKRRSIGNFFDNWLFSWPEQKEDMKPTTGLAIDSIKAWYLSLESGRIWFPAQVYNRETQNGVSGFMLSCYDARLCYDSESDSFVARYSSHGRRRAEEHIDWGRLRVSPIDTTWHELYASDCLNDLKPGDHIEIQWRRSKEFPYGWWYCIVGHLETCDGDENCCKCYDSDEVKLEFNQYAAGSRWRKTVINRRGHREIGGQEDGFYGGIRKLGKEEEIKRWKHLWPAQNL